jgi:hypothetical protein
MPETTNREDHAKIYFIIGGILLAVITFVIWVWGASSIFKAISVILQICLGLACLFGVFYLFWLIFLKKQAFDVNYVNKQNLLKACKVIKYPFLKDLYISGDKGHSRGLVGKIAGWCRIQISLQNQLYEEKKDESTGVTTKIEVMEIDPETGRKKPVFEVETIEQDVFAVKKKGLAGIFSEDMCVRVDPRDHNELIGDVDLYGFSLIPMSEFMFLNSDHLDVKKIDYALEKEASRITLFRVLSNMATMTEKSMGVDSVHTKFLEKRSLMELPETSSSNQNPSPYQQ